MALSANDVNGLDDSQAIIFRNSPLDKAASRPV